MACARSRALNGPGMVGRWKETRRRERWYVDGELFMNWGAIFTREDVFRPLISMRFFIDRM